MKKRFLSLILSMVLCLGLFAPAMAAEKTFSDVPKTHWAYQAVGAMVDKGLFSGTSETTFSPGKTMTRSMLVQVLYRYAGSPEVTGTVAAKTAFKDVPEDAYYAKALVWANENNLLPAWFRYNDGEFWKDVRTEFLPDQVMPRFDFVYMLYQFARHVLGASFDELGLEEIMGVSKGFDDLGYEGLEAALAQCYPEFAPTYEDIMNTYTLIAWAYLKGIVSGVGERKMAPAMNVSRAQVAVMLQKFDQIYGQGSSSQGPSEMDYYLELAIGRVELEVGESCDILVAYTGYQPETPTYRCTSSDPSVLSVQTVADDQWELVGVAAGSVTVTVTDSNGKSASAKITVVPRSVQEESEFAQEVVRLVNVERAKENLPALKSDNAALTGAAQLRAGEIVESFSHTRPNGSSCFTAMKEAGISYGYAGENIAAGYATPAAVVEGWMNSSGHRANILSPNFDTIGVGYITDSHGYAYWVQMFMSKR